MPTALLNAHAAEMPRISAEESLQAAERVAVGSGTLRRGEGRRITGHWARAANQHRPVLRSKSAASYEAQMAMAGISVKRVKPDG